MSDEKETHIYGTLTSDRHPDHKPYAGADQSIAANLVVAHGIDARMELSDRNYLWVTIERQDHPGVVLRRFRYSLQGNVWDEL